jgi:predicted nucleic acid-binding protein
VASTSSSCRHASQHATRRGSIDVILDTNVLSAVMGSRPAPAVAAWLAEHAPDQLFTVSVCQAEILSGIAILPKGRRRDGLQMAAMAMFREDFAGRVLPFDTEAAAVYAELFAALGPSSPQSYAFGERRFPSPSPYPDHPENIEFDTHDLIDAAVEIYLNPGKSSPTVRDPRQFELNS